MCLCIVFLGCSLRFGQVKSKLESSQHLTFKHAFRLGRPLRSRPHGRRQITSNPLGQGVPYLKHTPQMTPRKLPSPDRNLEAWPLRDAHQTAPWRFFQKRLALVKGPADQKEPGFLGKMFHALPGWKKSDIHIFESSLHVHYTSFC